MVSKYELEEFVENLEKIRGQHTELVTVYIPAGQNINTVARQIEDEKGTASNIKSKQNRKNVEDALDMISRHLKVYKKTPENGLALFCGNISDKEGQSEIDLKVVEPPQPLRTRLYRCDKEFVLEPLKKMLEVDEVYGLVVMDRKEATLGLLEGKQVKVLQKMTSGVPGKQRAGGQCLSPDTLIETESGKKEIRDVEIGDKVKGLDLNKREIVFSQCRNKWVKRKEEYVVIKIDKNKLVSSSEHTFFVKKEEDLIEMEAENLSRGDLLINEKLNEKNILSIEKFRDSLELVDIETGQMNFFANGLLVHNSSQRFERLTEGMAKDFFRRVAEAMKKNFYGNKKLKGIILGGPIPTKEDFLKEGQLITELKDKVIGTKDIGNTDEQGLEDLVEISDDLLEQQEIIHEKKLLEKFFEKLGKGKGAVYKKEDIDKSLKYGAVEVLLLSKELEKEGRKNLAKKAEEISAEVEMISNETEEGKQFLNMGGYGAILRFKV